MANVYEVDSGKLISVAAQKLKEKGIARPAYVDFVKTGPSRERIPQQKDFWYVRSASLLRQVYLSGPLGISRLRTRYGSRKGHVVSRHHHMRAGGSMITDALNALEKAGYVTKGKQGREITPSGRSFLDKVANEITRGA
ncbi:MAG: 30S ribosomal protein S19e [Candidatus Micrarchaeota archaeon]|nr:30S ribosomal protein S19e [Candidatus Micrarchaeota archaeon]